MDSIKEMVEKFDSMMVDTWNRYLELHDQLNNYKDKALEEHEVAPVNKILFDIQELFKDLAHGLHFIQQRTQFSMNALQGYTSFIENLKKCGATQVKGDEN